MTLYIALMTGVPFVSYAYPSVWSGTTATEFGALTSKYMTATTQALRGKAMTVVNTIGDPCIGGKHK
eukprot:COSAG02_NODE_676_length_18610_cov_44.695532_7_plen_67_part_00